jgi:hypothetical protein
MKTEARQAKPNTILLPLEKSCLKTVYWNGIYLVLVVGRYCYTYPVIYKNEMCLAEKRSYQITYKDY